MSNVTAMKKFTAESAESAEKEGCGYRIDLLIAHQVIVELKSVDNLQPIHEAQLLTYLRLSEKPVGLLLNFNVRNLRDGIRRLVHNL